MIQISDIKLLFVMLLLVIGCSSPTTITDEELQEVVSQATSMMNQYHEAINANGLMAEFDYLDSSEAFFWVPPGYHEALSYDSVRTILEQNSKALENVNFDWENLTVIPLSNKMASYNGTVIGNMMDTSGVQSEVRLIESGVLIKRSSGWKLLSGQSAVMPMVNDTL